jgi:HAE1 family hydrophobic/amphiphilic exporter-1
MGAGPGDCPDRHAHQYADRHAHRHRDQYARQYADRQAPRYPDRDADPRPISTSDAYAYPSTVAVGLVPFGVAVNPTTNRVCVTTNAGSATIGAVTGNVSKVITSPGMAWSDTNVTIGQTDVGTQVTDGFVNMAEAMLVVIGLVYLLLVPLVIFFALPPAVIGAFVSLAATGHVRDLSALIGLLMLIDIVDINATVLLTLAVTTNAIVLLDLVRHKIETGADVRTALTRGGRTRVRPIVMTAAATILALIPLTLSSMAMRGHG